MKIFGKYYCFSSIGLSQKGLSSYEHHLLSCHRNACLKVYQNAHLVNLLLSQIKRGKWIKKFGFMFIKVHYNY